MAGKKVEVILKDDAGTADTTRRIAQELVVNDKVDVLAGFGLTPLALATAPIATQEQDADGRDGGGDLDRSPSSRPSSCAPASRCRRSTVAIADWARQERDQEGR